jgi:hypothetical protein
MAGGVAATRAALVAAAVFLVHGRPGPALGLGFRNAARFVAFGDVVRLALLLVRVFRLVAAGHGALHPSFRRTENERAPGPVPAFPFPCTMRMGGRIATFPAAPLTRARESGGALANRHPIRSRAPP